LLRHSQNELKMEAAHALEAKAALEVGSLQFSPWYDDCKDKDEAQLCMLIIGAKSGHHVTTIG